MKTSRFVLCIVLVVLVLPLATSVSAVQNVDALGEEITGTNSEIRYPISDGKLGLWREGVPGADVDNWRYNEIDDPAGAHDGDATYLVTTYVKSYWAGTAVPAVPADATNIAVATVWTVRYEVEDSFHVAWPLLVVNGTFYIGPRHNPGTTYTTYADVWTSDPSTGLPWTPATANMVNGVGFDSNVSTPVHVTQAYIYITYDTGLPAAIDVEKYVWDGTAWVDADTAPGPALSSGTIPRFRFVLTNTSGLELSDVDLTDDVYGDIALDGTLAPDACAEYIITGTWAQGQHTNTAAVTARYGGNTYVDSDAANYYGAAPALALAKSASPTTYGVAGDVITYSYELANSGDFPLDGPFTVTDDKASVACPDSPAGLAPGETMVCTASHVITPDDLNAGSVTNTAQGHAYYAGAPVDSNVDDETVTANEAQLGVSTSTCAAMRDGLIAGTALEQTQIVYSGGETILSLWGVTSYWTRLNSLSGTTFNLAVQQAVTSDYGFAKYLAVKQLPTDNILLYDSTCRRVLGTITNVQGGTVDDPTVSFTFTANRALAGGPYYLQVRYDHALLKNQAIGASYPPSGGTLAHYDLATLLDGSVVASDSTASHSGGYGGLNLKRK